MFHMTRATAPAIGGAVRCGGEARVRAAGLRGVRRCVVRQDTIPKPDGLAGPLRGPSSNQNRTQLAQCPALFEPGPAIVRSDRGRLAVGFAAMLDGSDVDGIAVVVEAEAVVADAQAELRRLDVL